MYSAGIRVSELSRLRYEDIHRSKMNIYISRSKNRSDRYAVLSDKALEILTLYWFRCGRPTDWLFPGQKKGTHIHKQSVYQVLKNQLAHLGWEDKGFDCHSLRHGFGLHLYESGADLIAIKDAMGHKSISSTSVYVSMGIGNGRRIISPYDFANKA